MAHPALPIKSETADHLMRVAHNMALAFFAFEHPGKGIPELRNLGLWQPEFAHFADICVADAGFAPIPWSVGTKGSYARMPRPPKGKIV